MAPIVGWIIFLGSISALFLLIGLHERREAFDATTGSIRNAWVVKSIAMVGIALFFVWRGRRDLGKH